MSSVGQNRERETVIGKYIPQVKPRRSARVRQDLMRVNKNKVRLPIGHAARLTVQLEALRMECCQAAETLMKRKKLDEQDLEECARLDDGLAEAYRILKSTITQITLARLKRRIRTK